VDSGYRIGRDFCGIFAAPSVANVVRQVGLRRRVRVSFGIETEGRGDAHSIRSVKAAVAKSRRREMTDHFSISLGFSP
jgi:hypothetical protein